MEIGDYVLYKDEKTLYKIDKISDLVLIKGVYERIVKYVDINDLVITTNDKEENNNYYRKSKELLKKPKGYITGKILHLDGDMEYLEMSLDLYNSVGAYAVGIVIDESLMANEVLQLIEKYESDIIVITGHDSYNNKGIKNLDNYLNSKNFIEAVKKIRKVYSMDDKLIVAGACGSNFEALIAAGANFASSPKRVNVHLYDPSIVAIKAAFTPFNRIVSIKDIFRHSYIKEDGIGGVESYGKMRLIL